MEHAACHSVRGGLSFIRKRAAAFLDSLSDHATCDDMGPRDWIAEWTKIGDDHLASGDVSVIAGAFDQAKESWLCALTCFEVARRMVDHGSPRSVNNFTKVEDGIQRFESYLPESLERVNISCYEGVEVPAYYLMANHSDLPGPAVICISMEGETGTTLLGKLLPVLIGRRMAVLIISHDDVAGRGGSQSAVLLAYCFDYLARRPDVDPTRIGVYGEGLSAALATEFAASDHRLAAAVCDGGIWNWTRAQASIGWLTSTTDDSSDERAMMARRSRVVRRMKCPVLVAAGGNHIVDVLEAIKLQADCLTADIDVSVALPRLILTPGVEIDNFVISDNSIFEWLERMLRPAQREPNSSRDFYNTPMLNF